MSTTRSLRAGDRISEYVLEKRIGGGGFGEVWRAHHHIWKDKAVAIKFPTDPEAVRRFHSEGVLAHRLSGPNVVETLGFDPEHDPPYLIMEYVPGEDLATMLERKGKLQTEQSLHIMLQLTGILAEAHDRGIVHRDIKPSNVMITPEGTAKLTDFGLGAVIAKATSMLLVSGEASFSPGSDVAGTLAYMAPEQRDPSREVDGRADIYSLGIMFFQMLTGVLPEGAEKPSSLVASLDYRLDRIFERCYARLENRYSSVRELAAAIEAALEPEPEKKRTSYPKPGTPVRQPFLYGIQPRYLRGRPAEFGSRLIAAMIDFFVLGVIVMLAAPFLNISSPLLVIIYYILGVGLWGKTLGKAALGMSVVGPNLGNPGLVRGFVRFAGYFFSLILFGLGFILIALTPRARGLHDYLSGTSVVYDYSIKDLKRGKNYDLDEDGVDDDWE
ncbi:MAG: protein kinase domain-containing protein [Planctomycetota bacterium]|jgi:uncharacterized RDD family membrane protein YckC